MAQYANYHRDPKTCPDPFTPFDYTPYLERPENLGITEIDLADEKVQAQIDRDVFGM